MTNSEIWKEVIDDFTMLMDVDLSGATVNTFKKFTGGIDWTKKSAIPASLWNGAYSINYAGMESTQLINCYIHYIYNVKLQVAFSLNDRDDRASYNRAVLDLENIVRVRLQTSTWATPIINIEHIDTSDFDFYNVENETFAIVNITFRVTGQALIQ